MLLDDSSALRLDLSIRSLDGHSIVDEVIVVLTLVEDVDGSVDSSLHRAWVRHVASRHVICCSVIR